MKHIKTITPDEFDDFANQNLLIMLDQKWIVKFVTSITTDAYYCWKLEFTNGKTARIGKYRLLDVYEYTPDELIAVSLEMFKNRLTILKNENEIDELLDIFAELAEDGLM